MKLNSLFFLLLFFRRTDKRTKCHYNNKSLLEGKGCLVQGKGRTKKVTLKKLYFQIMIKNGGGVGGQNVV